MARPDPEKPMRKRSAVRFFLVVLVLDWIATLMGLAGIATLQGMCHNNSMAQYWTPAYTQFIAATAELKPWTCSGWMMGYWWVMGCQLLLLISITLSYFNGFLARHALAIFASGATASALIVVACLAMADNGPYWIKGTVANNVGNMAFAGYFAAGAFNGALGVATAELLFATTGNAGVLTL